MKSLLKRILTSIVLIVVVYLAVRYLADIYFSLLLLVVIGLVVYEFIRLCKPNKLSYLIIAINGILIAISFTFELISLSLTLISTLIITAVYLLLSVKQDKDLVHWVRDAGIYFLVNFYLIFPLYHFLKLKQLGANYLFILIMMVAIGDSAAYFVGSTLGRKRIYPVASPNKTLAGLIGSIVFAAGGGLLGYLVLPFPREISILVLLVTGGVMGLLSQLADPFESIFKRSAGQKDSGNILPGHGGLLDRLDGYVFCAPALYYIVVYIW